ncbi:MAG: MoxR family ATPase [Firmicutes bacterium]|nr:MoxR family ATPase [Bacillota bacterium]MBQ4092695.1 MoxR family ATPase [Bacillota bacterium]MBQ6810680.1 MoxR family ATPase [Bacillota bacterium]
MEHTLDITLNELKDRLEAEKYIADDSIIIPLFLALKLGKPLLITGAAGVGKTEIAKVVAKIFDMDLIRLQCYEGLDENKALYEWNYQKQLLHIQSQNNACARDEDIFSEDYLLSRPVLKALRSEKKCVLLIDEIDKTDAEFEAFLFEVLSDFQVSVPEWGTIKAKHIPIVILTSNGERELSDGMKRRSVYLNISYPSIDKEIAIINAKVPELGPELTRQLARGTAYLRSELTLRKSPSIAEALDWARSLAQFDADRFSEKLIDDTMNLLLKDEDDFEEYRRQGGAAKMIRSMITDASGDN